jgi:hypothetical protein
VVVFSDSEEPFLQAVKYNPKTVTSKIDLFMCSIIGLKIKKILLMYALKCDECKTLRLL